MWPLRWCGRARCPKASAERYFQQVALLPIMTDTPSHAHAATKTFLLSIHFGLSVYDAAYLELVLRVGGTLATNDKRLRTAALRAGASTFR